ncbi:hypothetical protein [Streptomyces chartreusis]|uniref:Lipoprotein n=1 Tax=Streptomyces chartreusis TaxID=1969 RepID=A0A7H8TA55_STRCX|nr:hypothetical protein [Streptomyces chartreusis]QKZ20284.1 hypothetical protein HUT05_24785 [Streptomyces chartreusis]
MNSTVLRQLAAVTMTLGATTLLVSCADLAPSAPSKPPVRHGIVIDKYSRTARTENTVHDVYKCRTLTTKAVRSSLALGKTSGGSSGGRGSGRTGGGSGGSGGGGLIGGLFGGGEDRKPKGGPSKTPSGKKPAPRGGSPKSPGTGTQRKECTKVGERTVPTYHPAVYKLRIKAKDGRTAWRTVTVSVYLDTKKGDKV